MKSTCILVVYLACITIVQVDGACRRGMTEFRTSCYVFVHQEEDWVESMEVCREFDGYLVEIDSAEENKFIIDLIKNNTNPGPDNIVDVWTGGNDLLIEGMWEWMNSGTGFSYTDWFPGNPSNSLGSENCMQLHYQNHFAWNDKSCLHKTYFVCESEGATDPSVFG